MEQVEEIVRYETYRVLYHANATDLKELGEQLDFPIYLRILLLEGELHVYPLPETIHLTSSRDEIVAKMEMAVLQHPSWWPILGFERPPFALRFLMPEMIVEWGAHMADEKDVRRVVDAARQLDPIVLGSERRQRALFWKTARELSLTATLFDLPPGRNGSESPVRSSLWRTHVPKMHLDLQKMGEEWSRIYAPGTPPILLVQFVAALCGLRVLDPREEPPKYTTVEYGNALKAAILIVEDRQ